MSEPCFLTAAAASRAIAAGRLTGEALVRSCLERIEARDPAVKAWLHLDPRAALAAAGEADKRSRRSPLHGLPFGVKDSWFRKPLISVTPIGHRGRVRIMVSYCGATLHDRALGAM